MYSPNASTVVKNITTVLKNATRHHHNATKLKHRNATHIANVIHDVAILNGGFTDFSQAHDIYNALMAILCVTMAGLASGLTIGLLSFDVTKLEIKAMTGTQEEVSAAIKILPVVKHHHLLLVTLMLFNSIANEALPIFLGALVPAYLAVLISVTFVLIFGEVFLSFECYILLNYKI